MAKMTATDVSRNFSEVLSRVASGETVEIVRNGAPVARLGPAGKPQFLSGDAFVQMLRAAPAVDEEFASDVIAARRELPEVADPWPS